MSDVTLQVRINGGSVQTGAVSAAVGNTVQLTAANKAGWNVASVRWELYDFPPDMTVPAGWSTASDGSYYVLGSADPPSFSVTHWGKILPRVTASHQTDERTAVDVPSASGLRDMMAREGAQFGGQRLKWAKHHKENLRLLDLAAGMAPADAVAVAPSGDTTGATDRANIVAALATGNPVRGVPGSAFYTDQRIVIPSGCDLDLGEGSWLNAGDDFPPTSADDATAAGCMVLVSGAVTGAVSTTLAATYWGRAATFTLTSGVGLANGMWLKMEGTNAADLPYQQSDSESLFELVSVASFAGAVVTPADVTVGAGHAIGKPVVSYAPNLDTTIRNLNLDANGKLIAVGLRAEGCVRLRLGYVSGRGFSRYLFEERGCRATMLAALEGRGGNNGLHHASSCQLGMVYEVINRCEGARVHASGIPRAAVWVDDHCAGYYHATIKLEFCTVAYRRHGCYATGYGHLEAHDWDFSSPIARDATLQGVIVGVVEGGMNELAGASFGMGNYSGTTIIGNGYAADIESCGVYIHDQFLEHWGTIQIFNKGLSPVTGSRYFTGVITSDCTGTINALLCFGVQRALRTKNVFARMSIASLIHDPRGGQGSVGNTTIQLTHSGGASTSPVIHYLETANNNNVMLALSPWTSTPDRTFMIRQAMLDGFHWTDIIACTASGTINPGDVVRITGNQAVRETTGPHASNGVCASVAYNGWTLVALGRAVCRHSGAATTIGEYLQADTAYGLATAASPTANTARFRCVSPSSGGYVGVMAA